MSIYKLVFSDHIYTQLPFFIEHKSPCTQLASLLHEIRIDLSIVSSLVQKCNSVIGRFLKDLNHMAIAIIAHA